MRLNTVGKMVAALSAAAMMMVTACGSDDNAGGASTRPSAAAAQIDCGGKNDLTAEGSTAQQNAIAVFNRVWGRLCPGKSVAYNPTGSGAGREQFIAGHVDFAGSDAPLAPRQIDAAVKRCAGHPAWQLPLVFGPIALVYNLAVVNPLVVNADVLAKIFSGAITTWNDPALVALNPGVALPDTKITPVYRSDSSGTTDNFQNYLAAAAPESWGKGGGTEFQGGVGEGAQKSAGVVQAVQASPGAIGYVEKGFADQARMPYARMHVGGQTVPLTEDTARTAIDGVTFVGKGDDLILDLNSLYTTKEPGAYPVMLATYEIVCSQGYDPGTAAAVKSFLTVAANNGQSELSQAGYVPLPDKFKRRLIAAINAIQ